MSFRPQSGHNGTGKLSKAAHDKKTKEKKQRQTAKKSLKEETIQASPKEAADKAVAAVTRLGSQVFALSPFGQYFDDWLVHLRQVVSEFETTVNADEQFQTERTQIFQDIITALTENRLAESTLSNEAQLLADTNHKIADADKQYAEATREINNKRNCEIQKLNNNIRMLEDDLAAQQQVKLGFFKFKEKRIAQENLARTTKELTAAKNELEVKQETFKTEQDKLHDNYQLQKQQLSAQSDRLHKELEKLETDTSTEPRQKACNALTQSINTMVTRLPAT
jgi:hypothetical protein